MVDSRIPKLRSFRDNTSSEETTTVTQPSMSGLKAFALSTGNAVAADFGDEILRTTDNYRLAQEIENAENTLKNDGIPANYTMSKILGSLVPGGLLAKGASKVGLLGKAASRTGKARELATVGAAEGAAFAAGEAEGTASERIDDALTGAAIGAVAAPVGAAVGSVAGGAIKRFVSGGQKLTPEEKTFSLIADEISAQIGLSKDDFITGVQTKGLTQTLEDQGLTPEQSKAVFQGIMESNPILAQSFADEGRAVADSIRQVMRRQVQQEVTGTGDELSALNLSLKDSSQEIGDILSNMDGNELIKRVTSTGALRGERAQLEKILKTEVSKNQPELIKELGYKNSEDIALSIDPDNGVVTVLPKNPDESPVAINIDGSPIQAIKEYLTETADKIFKESGNKNNYIGVAYSDSAIKTRQVMESSDLPYGRELAAANINHSRLKSQQNLFNKVGSVLNDQNPKAGQFSKIYKDLNETKEGVPLLSPIDKEKIIRYSVLDKVSQKNPGTIPSDFWDELYLPILNQMPQESRPPNMDLKKYVDDFTLISGLPNFYADPPQLGFIGRVVRNTLTRLPTAIAWRDAKAGFQIAIARATTDELTALFRKQFKNIDPKEGAKVLKYLAGIDNSVSDKIFAKTSQEFMETSNSSGRSLWEELAIQTARYVQASSAGKATFFNLDENGYNSFGDEFDQSEFRQVDADELAISQQVPFGTTSPTTFNPGNYDTEIADEAQILGQDISSQFTQN